MQIYLDYAATAPLDKDVLSAMLPCFTERFGNPDSLHGFGQRAMYAVETARAQIADLLGVLPQEVFFTSGGTEADNWAVRGLAPDGTALVSEIEHAAVLEAAALRKGTAYVSPSAEGIVTAEAVERAMTAETKLVCVMAVNNETGCIQPVREISEVCRARGALLICDCVQAANELDLKELASYCGALSLSAHKVYGPKGAGVLVVKGGKIAPLLVGGEQERGLRGGTRNVAGIVGTAAALKKTQTERIRVSERLNSLRGEFERLVKNGLGDRVQIDGTNRIGGISHMTFDCGGPAFLTALDMAGVAASGGAACSAHSQRPSHVMLAMGRSEEESRRGVRFSFGRDTTAEEVSAAARAVIECALRN